MPTVVVTDHAALTWLFDSKEPITRLARWVMTLMEYNLTYIHRKGVYNVVADALSRLKREIPDGQRKQNAEDEFVSPLWVGNVGVESSSKVTKEKGKVTEVKTWIQQQRDDLTCRSMIDWLSER